MARKSEIPLEAVKLRLFDGDFERLGNILSPRRVHPTVFIRHLVRKTLNAIEAKANLNSQPVEINADELIRDSQTDPLNTARRG